MKRAAPAVKRHSIVSAAAIVAVALTGLSACSVFKSNEEAQVVITQRVVGMPAGDFFQTFGQWRIRQEQGNGSTEYEWQSSVGAAPAGPNGLDERVCFLHVVAARNGRIETAVIVRDNPGRTSTSRCGEIFKTK